MGRDTPNFGYWRRITPLGRGVPLFLWGYRGLFPGEGGVSYTLKGGVPLEEVDFSGVVSLWGSPFCVRGGSARCKRRLRDPNMARGTPRPAGSHVGGVGGYPHKSWKWGSPFFGVPGKSGSCVPRGPRVTTNFTGVARQTRKLDIASRSRQQKVTKLYPKSWFMNQL